MDFQIEDCSEEQMYLFDPLRVRENRSLQTTLAKLVVIIENDSTHQIIIDNLSKHVQMSDKYVKDKVLNALQFLSVMILQFYPGDAKFTNRLYINKSVQTDNIECTLAFNIEFNCYGDNCTFNVTCRLGLGEYKCKLFSATLSNNMY